MARTFVHTVTLPDGKALKRTSVSRNYTHVVVGTYKSAVELAWNRDGLGVAEWAEKTGGTKFAITWSSSEALGQKALRTEQRRLTDPNRFGYFASVELLPCELTVKLTGADNLSD